MSLLLETIKVRNRKFYYLPEHGARMNSSRRELFNRRDTIDLEEMLTVPSTIHDGLYKCRVEYDTEIRQIEFQEYARRECRSLRLVRDDTISYEYKYADRTRFELLLRDAGVDDIIIVKNGLLTDASYANIILSDGTKWCTPRRPLLKGIRREILLRRKLIVEADIAPSDLSRFVSVALINVMLPMDVHEAIPIDAILPLR